MTVDVAVACTEWTGSQDRKRLNHYHGNSSGDYKSIRLFTQHYQKFGATGVGANSVVVWETDRPEVGNEH